MSCKGDSVSNTTLQLAGVHHVSALSAHIERTHDFYTRVLGLRPVIKTVNQNEPSMYHMFYGDGAGSPGFTVDGPLDGVRLSLPPFLEPRRAEIEARLKPLNSVHA
jgi:catechol 2,3-dioxygenase-like lactoylglutathione lyase family enzyme